MDFLNSNWKKYTRIRQNLSKNSFYSREKAKTFFSDKYSNDIFKLKEFQTSHKTKNSTGINSKIAKTSLEDSYQTNNTFIKTEYYELINPLEDLIKKCLKRKREFVLIYDDLDELEDKMSEDSNYYPLLFTMLNIIKDINLNLRSIGKKKSKIIVCLRSDIIDDIHKYSSNSNKLTSDNKVDLYWISKNYDNPEDHPLMEMILLKIKHSVPEYSQLDKSSLYKKIFPKRIQNQEVIDYLIDYSYGRPRDIISYLNIIMHNYPEATHFEPKYFTDCSKEYSKWFHNELENEISISPKKDMLIDSVRLINDFKKRTFHFEEIEEFFLENKQNYPNISDIKESIRYLYKYGVIGNSWVHRRKRGKKIFHYSWGYRNDANTEPTYTQTFVIHYGLRKHFSL